MIAKETNLQGCFVIEPQVFEDTRGYFLESFNQRVFNELIGEQMDFVQDNESMSTKGTLRGLHFQKGIHAQAKLVRVTKGAVLDVVVDIRPNSPTFGRHLSLELSEHNKKQLFIPRGFAHGFIVLSNEALFSYKCDNYYHKPSESGIIYNDPRLNIDWKLAEETFIISERDKVLPTFDKIER